MAAGGWGCPHEIDGTCSKVLNLPCDPGMKGCELYGRFVFFDESKNTRPRQKSASNSIDPACSSSPLHKTRETQ